MAVEMLAPQVRAVAARELAVELGRLLLLLLLLLALLLALLLLALLLLHRCSGQRERTGGAVSFLSPRHILSGRPSPSEEEYERI